MKNATKHLRSPKTPRMERNGENKTLIKRNSVQAPKGVGQECCYGNLHTDSTCFRYIVMVFICLVSVGDYFIFDNPAALEEHFLKDLNISQSKYMVFYSSVQWFQMGTCLFGGYLVDKVIGMRWSLVMSTGLLTLDQVLFSVGALINSYWTMVLTRMFFGIFEGIMFIAIKKIIVKWFRNKELTFVFGLKISISRAGTVADMNVMGHIYDYLTRYFKGHVCLGMTLFTGAGVCFVSFIAALLLCYMDKKDDTIHTEESKSKEPIKMTDVRYFPLTYWLIVLLLMFYLQTILCFAALGLVFFQMKYGLDSNIASNVNSIVFIIGAIVVPFVGILVDKSGRNLYWMFIGVLLQIISHAMLAFTFLNPYIAMSCLGISYCFSSSAMWPLLAYVVELKYFGTAMGIVCTALSIGQAGVAYIAGYLADNYGYITMEMLFLTCSCVTLVLCSLLYIIDNAGDGKMNCSKADRLAMTKIKTSTIEIPDTKDIDTIST